MPPTSSSPSSRSRSLSHLHFKEPESCAGTSPPYHLCTISTGTPSAQPRWMWCSLSFLLTFQLHCGNHWPCWVKRGGDPEYDLFRTVVATLSSWNTRGRSTHSALMETVQKLMLAKRRTVEGRFVLWNGFWYTVPGPQEETKNELRFRL